MTTCTGQNTDRNKGYGQEHRIRTGTQDTDWNTGYGQEHWIQEAITHRNQEAKLRLTLSPALNDWADQVISAGQTIIAR